MVLTCGNSNEDLNAATPVNPFCVQRPGKLDTAVEGGVFEGEQPPRSLWKAQLLLGQV